MEYPGSHWTDFREDFCSSMFLLRKFNFHENVTIIIIIIINWNWVVTLCQWLFYMYTKYEIGY